MSKCLHNEEIIDLNVTSHSVRCKTWVCVICNDCTSIPSHYIDSIVDAMKLNNLKEIINILSF